MDDDVLKTELEAFEADRARLLQESEGKFALYHQSQLVGCFVSDDEAIEHGYETFGNVPFLVKEIRAVDREEYIYAMLAS